MVRKYIAILIAVLAVSAFAPPASAQEKTAPADANAAVKAKAAEKTVQVTGKVVKQDKKPIVNAKVIISPSTQVDSQSVTVYTDKKGAFSGSITAPKKGYSLFIAAMAKGYTCATSWQDPNNKKDLTFTLFAGAMIKGVIVDEKDKPLEGAKVTLSRSYAYGNGTPYIDVELPRNLRTVTTGKDGTFKFDHVPDPETYQYVNTDMEVEKAGRALISQYISKEQMTAGPVRITDPLECKLNGTLYLPGKMGVAPEGTNLEVKVSFGNMAEGRGASVGKDGKFAIAKLPPGKVDIILSTPPSKNDEAGRWVQGDPYPWALPAVTGVEVSPKAEKTVELVLTPGALIKGKVLDKKTSKPISAARLNIVHGGRPENVFPDSIRTDKNGEFQVRTTAGNVKMAVEAIENESYVHFQPEDRPEFSLKMADGEDKTDVVLNVSAEENSNSDYNVSGKPIPPDFEIKPGTYELAWDPEVNCFFNSYGRGKYWGEAAKSKMKVTPKVISERAQFAAFAFDSPEDDGLLFVIFDESQGTKKGWDTVYIDLNRNGDLTDDGAPQPISGSDYQKRTDWVTVHAHQGPAGGEQTSNPYQVRLSTINSDSDPYAMVQRKGTWKGTVDTNKGQVECAVGDMNQNGLFSDLSQGDYFFINDNGYSKLVTLTWGPHAISLYKISKVGNKFYMIKPTPLGNKITIEPYTGPMGQIAVRGEDIQGMKATVSSIYVEGENGYYGFDALEGKPTSLPAGSYSVNNCSINIDGKLPATCSLSSKVDVQADKQASVVISGKLKMDISKDQKKLVFKTGNTETINWDIRIGNNVKLDSIGDRNNGKTPKVRFFDKAGKLVGTTNAGYT